MIIRLAVIETHQRGQEVATRLEGTGRGQLFDETLDGLRVVQVPQGAESPLAMGAVNRIQAGVDRPERHERSHGQVGYHPVRVGLGIHGPLRGHQ